MGDFIYYILFGLIAVIFIILAVVIYTLSGMRRSKTGGMDTSPVPVRIDKSNVTGSTELAPSVTDGEVAAITAAIYTILASELPAGEQPLFLVRSIRRYK